MDRSPNTVSYHLGVLGAAGLVQERHWEGTKGYWLVARDAYLPNPGGNLLRTPAAQSVWEALRRQPGLTPGELIGKSGLSRMAVRYHVKRLQKAGLVTTRKDGKRIRLYGSAPEA